MTSPRFSIVLPTHNRADVLPFAIRSVLAQTEPDFELLIAADGCTDDTPRVVAAFDDPRIRWFALPKVPGIGYANRNAVLRHARGGLIAYLAHDDLWLHDHLERFGRAFDAPVVEFAHSRLLVLNGGHQLRPSAFNMRLENHAAGLWRGEAALTMSAVVHRQECLTKYGFWHETQQHFGDFELWHRIVSGAGLARVAVISEPTSIHFVANWRRTPAHGLRTSAARWLIGDWLERRLPPPLHLDVTPGESEQAAMWRRLSRDPSGETAAIRDAVMEFHDELLWPAQTVPGVVGTRFGQALGRSLRRVWLAIRWIAPKHRRRYATLRNATRARERKRRAEGIAPGHRGR